jgi:hypothetical protein
MNTLDPNPHVNNADPQTWPERSGFKIVLWVLTYLDRDGDVDEGGDQLDRNGGQDVGQEYRAS